MEELTNLEITEEELEKLTPEELADAKVRLEELLLKCDELLQDDNEE